MILGKRLNIGLLVDDIDAVFTNEACKGAVLGAEAIDANMYIFPGGYLDVEDISEEHYKYEYQYNTIFSYANQERLDILYVMMGMIASRVQVEERIKFLEQFTDVPVVALYTKMDGYPSVIFDNKIGFKDAIRHMLVEHKVETVGYVSGPKTNVDAMERLEAFQEVLKEQNIPYDEKYVIYGNFEESTETLVRDFVLKYPHINGLVFANDRMALGGYRALYKLDITVGEQILMVSFDNSKFASTLVPPLSTVEANAAELSYQAIINAETFLNRGSLDNLEIGTRFVKRSSCGCQEADYEKLSFDMGFDFSASSERLQVQKLHAYLFGNYGGSPKLQQIEDNLIVFIKMLYDMVKEKQVVIYRKRVQTLFRQIVAQSILSYTTVESFFNMLISLQHMLIVYLDSEQQKIDFMQIFADMYRDLALSNCLVVQGQQEGLDRMSHLVNNMSLSMFFMENTGSIPWASALENLDSVGFHSAYMYTFQETIEHERYGEWKQPKKMLLKAYYNEEGAFNVPEEKQLLSTKKLFRHEFMPKKRRVTMVLSPLFSGKELFGLLLSEVDYENFGNVEPINFQLSSALKSLLLIEKQQQVQKQLEESIVKFKESNDILNEISRSDELTGLYNRRGFLEFAHAAITSIRNRGKKALVVYADMDNLKMINDNFGHDEGDFALREIAAILRDTFRSTDIVARFGGDEFVAFATVGVGEYTDIMKRRIAEITARHNTMCSKPYPIEMSVGICEFECGKTVDLYDVLDIADENLYEEKRLRKEQQGTYR